MRADDDLIRAAKLGDPGAWRELYLAHAGRLVIWLRTLPSNDVALAPDDIAAEAWLTSARRLGEFHGTADEFAGWLFGIARKTAANASRRSARRATRREDLDPTDPAAEVESLVTGEDWVRRTLATLPRREREVLACLEVVGLDIAGTARALGISLTAVRVTRHRALKRLRTQVPSPSSPQVPASSSPQVTGAEIVAPAQNGLLT